MKSTPNVTHSTKGRHTSSNATTSDIDNPQQGKKQRPNLRRIDSENEEGEEILSESFPDDTNVDEEFSDEADGVDDLPPGKAGSGAKGSQISRSREAKDISHFFQRGDKKTKEKTICVVCWYVLQPSDPQFSQLKYILF